MDPLTVLKLIACFVLTIVAKIGLILTKKGVCDSQLPPLSLLKCGVIRQYLCCKMWLAGIFCDIMAGVIGLVVLSDVPVSICTPIGLSGIALCAIFAHFILKEPLVKMQWIAVFSMLAAGVLASITMDEYKNLPAPSVYVIGGLFVGGLLLAVLLEMLVTRVLGSQGREPASQGGHNKFAELISGLEIGTLQAMGGVAVAGVLRLRDVYGIWFAIIGVQVVGNLWLVSAILFQRAFKFCSASALNAYVTITQLVGTVLMGFVVLYEPWPEENWKSVVRGVCLVAFGVSVFVFNWFSPAPTTTPSEVTSETDHLLAQPIAS